MPETSLYWIDDSTQDMYLIMEHVFPAVWDKGCSCKTILFGNDYCSKETESGPTDEARKAFESDLHGFFIVYCQGIDSHEWCDPGTTYREKKHLLPDSSVKLISIKNDQSDPIHKLAECWMNRVWLERIVAQAEKEDQDRATASDNAPGTAPVPIPESGVFLDIGKEASVNQLIADMDIPDNAVIALDICLLYKDIERIEANLPSISMALYAALSKNHRCYLYSSRSIARAVMKQWITTCKSIFGIPDGITIYPKNGLTVKQADTDAKLDLLTLLKGKE